MVLTEVGDHPAVKHLVYVDAAMWDVGEVWGPLLRDGVSAGWAACLRYGKTSSSSTATRRGASAQPGLVGRDVDEFVPGPAARHSPPSTHTAACDVPSTFIRPDDSDMLKPLQDLFAARNRRSLSSWRSSPAAVLAEACGDALSSNGEVTHGNDRPRFCDLGHVLVNV